MKEKILIAGGTGFIGYHILKELYQKRYNLFSISTKKPTSSMRVKNVKYIICDVTKKNIFSKKINQNFDHIINLSGNINHKEEVKAMRSHYKGCINLVNFFKKKKIKTFIQIGSSLEYGKIPSPQKESGKCDPQGNYGLAKYKSTKYVCEAGKINKFPYVVLRLYQIYGPNQKKNRLIPNVISSCLDSKEFNCTDGNQIRDFMHVSDLTSLIKKILGSSIRKKIYNVGSGKPTKVKNVINKIKFLIGRGIPKFGAIKMRKDEIEASFPHLEKIKRTYNWKPLINLEKGLDNTILFYKKNNFDV